MVSSESVRVWLGNNLVGRVSNLETLQNLGRLLVADGCGDIKLRYMGGLSVLVEFNSVDDAQNFLKQAKDSWSKWFEYLHFWTIKDNPKDRIAALIISGFPPHAYSSSAHSDVTKKLGTTLYSDEATFEDMSMAAGRITILTHEMGLINMTKKVKIDGILYKIRINEDAVETWNEMPRYPTTVLNDAIETDQSSNASSEFSLSDDEENNSEHVSESLVEKDTGNVQVEEAQKSKEGFDENQPKVISNTVDQPLEKDAINCENISENVFINCGNQMGSTMQDCTHSTAFTPHPKAHPFEGTSSMPQPPHAHLHIHNQTSAQGNNSDTTKSIDLNAKIPSPVESLNSHSQPLFTPRSRSRSLARMSRSKSLNSQPSNSFATSEEVQNTIEIGKLVGFQLDGFEKEVRLLVRNNGEEPVV